MKTTSIALTGAVLLVAPLAGAQVVAFSTFDPGDSYDMVSQGYTIAGVDAPVHQIVGEQFTSGVAGTLHSVRIPNRFESGNETLVISLLHDNADLLGSTMKTWVYASPNGSSHIDTLLNDDPSISLVAGEKYWLVASTPGDGVHFWNRANGNDLIRTMFSFDGGETRHYGDFEELAFDVNVNPVPEPATLSMLAGSVAVLIGKRRKLTS